MHISTNVGYKMEVLHNLKQSCGWAMSKRSMLTPVQLKQTWSMQHHIQLRKIMQDFLVHMHHGVNHQTSSLTPFTARYNCSFTVICYLPLDNHTCYHTVFLAPCTIINNNNNKIIITVILVYGNIITLVLDTIIYCIGHLKWKVNPTGMNWKTKYPWDLYYYCPSLG